MATSRIKTSSVLQGFPKSRSLLAGNAAYEPSSYESIATVTVGSGGSSSITFSSIPSGFKHLQIRCLTGSSSPTASSSINFNGDTTNGNYRDHILYGNGVSAVAATDGNYPYIGVQGSAMTTAPASHIIDILDYTDTNKYTTLRSLNGYDANGSGYVWYSSVLWMNTAAINQIVITSNGSNYNQYSHFALYGIKA